MKPPRPTGVLAVSLLLLAGTLVTVLVRLPEWSDLRGQVRVLGITLAAQTAEPTAPPHQAPPPSPPDSDLSEAERMELFRLRGEWLPLRRRAEELAPLEQTNADLKQRLAHARAHPEDVVPLLPPGYFLAKYARNVGQATPEAAVETWVWAMKNRDKKTLLRVVMPEIAAMLTKVVFPDPERERKFWKQKEILFGEQILAKHQRPDGSFELEMRQDLSEFDPYQEGEHLSANITIQARLIDGEWRLKH